LGRSEAASRFGPVTRTPAQDLTHFDSWGRGCHR
jgi:hypothetical protein